ncbi:DMT family transporter [Pseudomonas sp. SA3-5]|uniref:DMT family transporter n=1 Tax=Pseudomonas aestuarii TaxID=3018340 RepID=A0ABT4XDQ3_9PSED|nr:DMT family transporter [Pseudomonas aestuarii]MDA7086329.1 DMT family transporter [Pseudomonas aestuarii]
MIYLLPVLAALIWAGSTVVNRLAVGAIEPAAISFYRWLLAFVLLSPWLLPGVWRQRQLIARHFWQLFILGVLGMALYQSLAYFAAHTVSAMSMGLILGTMPLLTIFLAIPLLRTRPTPGVCLGGLLSFVGLALLISAGKPSQLWTEGMGSGELMMLMASISYALYCLLLKRWQLPVSTWVSLYVQIFCGLMVLISPFLLAPSVQLTAQNMPLVVYAGLFASGLAPGLWNHALGILGAERIAIFMNLVPLLTAVLAVLMLDEALHGYHTIGGGLILCGIALAQGRPKPAVERLPQGD